MGKWRRIVSLFRQPTNKRIIRCLQAKKGTHYHYNNNSPTLLYGILFEVFPLSQLIIIIHPMIIGGGE